MHQKRIRRVELERFRGATTTTSVDFDVSKPLVLMFGENGCGKSTICNALDFVCNQSFGSLESISSTDHTHVVSIGSDPSELKVRLFRHESSWEAIQKGRRVNVNPIEGYPSVKVLRRSELLKLVEAAPSERFESIRSFIDFQKYEVSEQNLRKALKTSRQSVERNAELHTQAVNLLGAIWREHEGPGETASSWAADILSKDLANVRTLVSLLSGAIKSIDAFESCRNTAVTAKENVKTAQSSLDEVTNQITAFEVGGASGLALVDMLNRVKAVIAEPYNDNECPACKSPYDLVSLRGEVNERIQNLKTADELNRSLTTAQEVLRNKQALFDESKRQMQQAIRSVEAALTIPVKESIDHGELSEEIALAFESVEVITEQQVHSLSEGLATLKAPLQEKLNELNRELTLFDSLKPAVEQIERTKDDLESEDLMCKGLDAALDIVLRARLEFTGAILDSVSDQLKCYWDAIHPDETAKLTKLALSETTKGSLNQFGSFGEHEDITPQAYFSESHLDTLGFCYWMAIAKYSSGGDMTLVLDDVFTSVDNQHASRIVDLLLKESENFNQIIVATHQRRWHDLFRFGVKSQQKATVLELDTWDHSKGIVVYPSLMEIDKLKSLIATGPFDRQAISSKAGVLLEQAFDELTKQYRSRMPRAHRSEYTLANYWDGTTKLSKKLKVTRPDSEGNQEEILFEEIHQKLQPFIGTRNQVGAHFNPTAEEFTDSDIKDFAGLAIEFIEKLLCSICKGFANRKNKNDGVWQCDCGTTKMLPYEI